MSTATIDLDVFTTTSEEGNPVVHLERWEYEYGHYVGIRRMTANWDRQDAINYQDKSVLQNECFASPASALCELAVAKYLGLYWHASCYHASESLKYTHLPDVGKDIEVRRVVKGAAEVRVADQGKKVWGARGYDDDYRLIEMLGFVVADEVLAGVPFRAIRVPMIDLKRPWA